MSATLLDSETFLARASRCLAELPADVTARLDLFREQSNDAGALLIPGLPIGELPATPTVAPSHGARPTGKTDLTSEAVLLGAAQVLGEPVGYVQEHGGDIVQDLFPLAASVGRQLSTSSGVELAFHTETAFHPHKPRFLLLLCLRGDANAATTLACLDAILPLLSERSRSVLTEARFLCGVDESFGIGSGWATPPMPVLDLSDARPEFTFDAELTVGLDREAEHALDEVRHAIARCRTSVTLVAGDLLVVDNHRAVHGRAPFVARFDGRDRWLQRTFVVADLTASSSERRGRVITTCFDANLAAASS